MGKDQLFHLASHSWYTEVPVNISVGRMSVKMWQEDCILSWIRLESWRRHQMETFSASLALCAGNSPVPVNSPHKGQWHGSLMFSLICIWINGWVNNREAGDLRRHRGHYDVNVMICGHHRYRWLNTLWPNDATWRQEKWLNTGSGDGLLPDGTKPLPEPMLTCHKWGLMAFIWWQF